ncbi:hypothetical protein SH2C18_05010 [Clostridium sediminicola]|uniref:hypothetical protein n=1 Tax=Clostridium sediminicola TaxID=3114879 RepID=UPI0031F27A50
MHRKQKSEKGWAVIELLIMISIVSLISIYIVKEVLLIQELLQEREEYLLKEDKCSYYREILLAELNAYCYENIDLYNGNIEELLQSIDYDDMKIDNSYIIYENEKNSIKLYLMDESYLLIVEKYEIINLDNNIFIKPI